MSNYSKDSFNSVAIVGAGPVGLSLALGLARQGVRSVLLEKKATTSKYSKAPAIHVRTREIFRRWGIEDRLINAGVLRGDFVVYNSMNNDHPLASLDFAVLEREADRPGILILEQGETERLLLEAVRESGLCDVHFSAEVVKLVTDNKGGQLTIRTNETEHKIDAEYIVGCDGASSFVRNSLGLPFDGITYSVRPMLADVLVNDRRDELAWPRVRNSSERVSFTVRLRLGLWRIIALERREPEESDEVPEEEVRNRTCELLGEGPLEVVWASRFRIHLRSSPRFRVGRVLLAGDAAHIHSPIGGMGMNAGIQDADNLAWKLAYALRGADVERLLDSYDLERREVVVENVSRFTDLMTRFFIQSPAIFRQAALYLFRLLNQMSPVRRRMLRRLTMINLGYKSSPILGRERAAGVRLPNPLLRSPQNEEVRLYDLLPNGPVIIDVAKHRDFTSDLPLKDVIRVGPGAYVDPSGLIRSLLPGEDGWILVRPDAYVAWARNQLDGMNDAVAYTLGLRN